MKLDEIKLKTAFIKISDMSEIVAAIAKKLGLARSQVNYRSHVSSKALPGRITLDLTTPMGSSVTYDIKSLEHEVLVGIAPAVIKAAFKNQLRIDVSATYDDASWWGNTYEVVYNVEPIALQK